MMLEEAFMRIFVEVDGDVFLERQTKRLGYTVVLIYFWLESEDLARARVKARVEKGGHDIAPEVIDRRYRRGLKNFFSSYQKLSDSWVIFDNSYEKRRRRFGYLPGWKDCLRKSPRVK
jgi:predicted ABC-type ATPase